MEKGMKKLVLGFAIIVSFTVTGCHLSKDIEINAFVADSDKVANEIVQKVKANPTVAGIEEAQKFLDGKKADLKAKHEALMNVCGYQVSKEAMKKFTDSGLKNAEAVNDLKLDFLEKTLEDKTFSEKINKLVNDFNTIYEARQCFQTTSQKFFLPNKLIM